MDLTLDPLYNATIPEETPCRWLVNIRHCKDEDFYVRVTLMGIVQAMIMMICTLGTLLLSSFRSKAYLTNMSSCCRIHISSLLHAFIHLGLSIIMILDPPMPYCLRYLLQYTFLLPNLLSLPYLSGLVSTRFTIVWIPNYQRTFRLRARKLLLALPWILFLFLFTIFTSGLLLDLRYPLEATLLFSLAMSLCALWNAIFIWICWMYGYRFSCRLSAHLNALDPSILAKSPKPKGPQPHHPDNSLLWSYLFSNDPCTSSPYDLEAKIAQTLADGQSVLGRMSILNFFFVAVNGLCLTFAIISLIFPVHMYTVAPLSKFLFILASPNRTILRSVVSVIMFALEVFQPQASKPSPGDKASLVERLCFHSNWYHQIQLPKAPTSSNDPESQSPPFSKFPSSSG
ncbi:MAG: hypothetical protein DHS80DRAFT_31729 [Piptocephalis tieghemiana]|nr:MAG: hypothetical protein DHS80DRAFT_31729 [Piptocephalis tieghemiana]